MGFVGAAWVIYSTVQAVAIQVLDLPFNIEMDQTLEIISLSLN